jgi:hypothetical protein
MIGVLAQFLRRHRALPGLKATLLPTMGDQSPANDAVVEPQGRLTLASFQNNIVNVIPAQYV